MTTQRIRPPKSLKLSAQSAGGGETGAQLIADRDTLREIVAGLDRLETLLNETPVPAAAAKRGYFTPDEDDLSVIR